MYNSCAWAWRSVSWMGHDIWNKTRRGHSQTLVDGSHMVLKHFRFEHLTSTYGKRAFANFALPEMEGDIQCNKSNFALSGIRNGRWPCQGTFTARIGCTTHVGNKSNFALPGNRNGRWPCRGTFTVRIGCTTHVGNESNFALPGNRNRRWPCQGTYKVRIGYTMTL